MKTKNIKTGLLSNLISAFLSGIIAVSLVGLVMGFKVSVINPSLIYFNDIWALASNLMLIYGFFGGIIFAIFGVLFYFIFKNKTLLISKHPFNLYLPAAFVITFFYYVRSYALSHFIANPLLPLKGAGWMNIGLTIILIALAVLMIKLVWNLFSRFNFKLIGGAGYGLFIIFWIAVGIVKSGESDKNLAELPPFEDYEPADSIQTKVALIGIDGAWWEIMDDLLAQDKLPNFKRLIENGVRGELKTMYPTYSAMIWTSIATGKLPQKHGINSFLVWSFPVTGTKIPMFRLPMMAPELLWVQENIATVSPIPSNYRMTEALWSIFSSKERSVGVMSWWASWPAEQVNGYLFTDHALFNKMEVLTNYKDKSSASIHDIYPPELLPETQDLIVTPADLTDEDIDRFINVESESFRDEFKALDTYDYLDIAYEASMFKFSYPGDKTLIAAAKYMLENENQPDFWAIYLQGMDSMSHQYLKYYFAEENKDKLNPVNVTRYRNLIENYYIYMDEAVGEFLTKMDPATDVFIVSDHGFDKEMLPTGHYHHIKPAYPGESEEFHVTDAHPGIFIASGPGIKTGATVSDISFLDITPTILAVSGFPYAQDMDGRIVTEIFENELMVDTIPTYDQESTRDRSLIETTVDKEVRDKLKALGYVK